MDYWGDQYEARTKAREMAPERLGRYLAGVLAGAANEPTLPERRRRFPRD